jgi:putative acetyltransferase
MRIAGEAVHLRGEQAGDERAIDGLVCSAFGSMSEANLVRLLRQHGPAFDARYSVTAWDAEGLAGYALFTPVEVYLMGETVPALLVAPVAVARDRQRQGIAAEMLRYGHDLGRQEGHRLASLMGHPDYYPRFGYRACYGCARMTINTERLPQPSGGRRGAPSRVGSASGAPV